MNRPDHFEKNFFIGREVEHSPAHGQMTLFVIGVQPLEEIVDIVNKSHQHSDVNQHITHVYFGADRSFPRSITTNDYESWQLWEKMIDGCLARDLWCSLDINIDQIEGLMETGFCEDNKFIPMISAPVPYLRLLGYNAVLKIDDRDFDFSNPGVWCHQLSELTSRSVFTDWSQYSQDQVL